MLLQISKRLPAEASCKIAVIKNVHRKYLSLNIFFNEVADLRAATLFFIKTLTQMFSSEYCKFF